ncbi:hypothetical protein Afil01_25560 [Actinorhabdospora filicis]|uniref:Cell division protein SepF n=1 Tax=Actinorhabdospora filicis TaxID=1785913 RepID=A0A9W6W8N5_9ACTN|nr:hypothetical protein Afil01_25560 [Actinorhabdospora filicis]
MRLGAVVTIAPRDHRSPIAEISHHIRNGRVVSLDLSHMDERDVIRLVDFCSGLISGVSGWIFRVSDSVLLLTPGPTADSP